MMFIDRIREDMTVISADDCCVGFISRLEDDKTLRITSVNAGYGYDHLIPLAWVSAVDRFVYLDRTSSYVAANSRQSRLQGARGSPPGPAFEDALLGSPATQSRMQATLGEVNDRNDR